MCQPHAVVNTMLEDNFPDVPELGINLFFTIGMDGCSW